MEETGDSTETDQPKTGKLNISQLRSESKSPCPIELNLQPHCDRLMYMNL